jgi:2-haloacid dehalogenase
VTAIAASGTPMSLTRPHEPPRRSAVGTERQRDGGGSLACGPGMIELARYAGLPWDCVITAENARCYKPRPEVYRTAIALLGLTPGEVMMVAAHNYDLGAARSEGMATAFVPRRLEYGPGQTTDLKPESEWDVVAEDFEDLAERLGC